MTKGKVLVLGSNATRIEVQDGGTGPTGNYLNETVVPAVALLEAGYSVVLATPNGTKPHIDEASDSVVHFGGDQAAYARAKAFYAEDPSMNQVRTLRSVIEEGLDGYAAVFVPGGQAPIVDLMQDPDAGEILRHFHEHSKPTALLCHGPIALISAMPHAREYRASLIAGAEEKAKEWAKGWQYAGYKMTIFSASEEKWVENDILHAKMYFNPPYALNTAGGEVSTTAVDFEPNVIIDRELITGQNPRSDHPIAAALIEALTGAGKKCGQILIEPEGSNDEEVLIKGKASGDIAAELNQAVGQKDLDAIMDCAGAVEMMQLAFSLLSISGHYADVGLVGDRIDIPLFPRVHLEQTFHGSFWGNSDLSEVMALAAEGKIRHSIKLFKFDEINENLELLRTGDIVSRAVMKF